MVDKMECPINRLSSTTGPSPREQTGATRRKKAPAVDNIVSMNDEIRTFHEYCINQEYSANIIKTAGAPLWRRLRKAKRKRWLTRLFAGGFILGLIACVTQCDCVYRLSYAYFRIASIKLLPYWDWTQFYSDRCAIQNPYFNGVTQELSQEDCDVCEHLSSITRVSNVSQTVMTDNFIKRDIPLIVTDALSDWPAQKLFNLQFLYELYVTDDVMKVSPQCMFASNIRLKSGGAKIFLTKAHKGDLSNWYAQWENCVKLAVRMLRQFFRRPYFLPAMVEVAERNWILISSDYNAKRFKPMDLATPLMWMVQLKGQNKVKLVPRAPCNESCTTMYAVLHEGETLIWTDFMWLVDYLPVGVGSHLNLAIVFGGYFD